MYLLSATSYFFLSMILSLLQTNEQTSLHTVTLLLLSIYRYCSMSSVVKARFTRKLRKYPSKTSKRVKSGRSRLFQTSLNGVHMFPFCHSFSQLCNTSNFGNLQYFQTDLKQISKRIQSSLFTITI